MSIILQYPIFFLLERDFEFMNPPEVVEKKPIFW